MECIMLNIFHICGLFLMVASHSPSIFHPNLPAGPYRLDFKAILRCDLPTNGKVPAYWYLSKKSANRTEVKGLFAPKIPINDSLDFSFQVAAKDAIGAWTHTYLTYNTSNICTAMEGLLGEAKAQIKEGLGMSNWTSCPIAAGNYTATGVDTDLYAKTNAPKTFVYGTYLYS